ncbi:MAG: arylsulfatase [Pirellulaceae bacterium]|jgi:arylsulfatase|nr:arylsulfatase [Pirellulaceae bacterium]
MAIGKVSPWVLVALCATALLSGESARAEDERPNVVLIMVDDLGFSDVGCYGGEIRTPHIDRLAAEGLQFTQFYNCAVCVTTRSALMTGLHPRRRDRKWLHEDQVTVAEVLRAAGYRTSLTGKWHLGSTAPRRPTDRGFEEYYGVASGCCNFFNPAKPDPVFYNGGKSRTFLHNEKRVTEFPDDFYTTDAFTDHAIGQIEKFAQGDAPFFVHLCYTAPHFPLHAREEDIAKYRGAYDRGYFELRKARFARQRKLGLIDKSWSLSAADKRLGEFRYDYDIAPWDSVEDLKRERRRMEVYAAMVDRVDQGIGRVMAALKDAGVDDNTLVLFLSDNGGCASYPAYNDAETAAGHRAYNKQLPGGVDTYDFCGPGWGWAQCTPFRRYKVWTYEGGIATPLIARWPATIAPKTRTDQIGHVVDVMATLVDLGRAAYPRRRNELEIPPLEGLSLSSVFRGELRPGHDHLCWALYGNRAVRSGDWKLVWGVTAARWELYNMANDRTETKDLAREHPELVKQLRNKWMKWAQATGVPLEPSGTGTTSGK